MERISRPVADGARVAPAELDGRELIRQLSAAAPEATAKLISNVAEAVWQSCQAVNLPAEIAEAHLAELPAIIDKSYVRTADRAMFFAPDGDVSATAMAELSQRILASNERDLSAIGVDDTVLGYLLESFLRSLYASRQLVQQIQPVLAGIVSGHAQVETEATRQQAAVTIAKIERAGALGISVPLLDVITVNLINLKRTVDLSQADLLAMAADARALDEEFERLTVIAPLDGEPLEPLPGLLRAGKIADCDRLLAAAEDQIVKHAIETPPHTAGGTPIAIELRKARAGLAALGSHETKTARHYGFAQRYVPSQDFERRWQLARLEAHYYELAAFRGVDDQGLEHAARACTSVLTSMSETPPSILQAGVQASLGHILIVLGEKECAPGRFELAGQLLADAHGFLETKAEPNGLLTRVAILRATALLRLGELHRDAALVEQGAQMYQAVIEAPGVRPADDFIGAELLEPIFGLRPRLALAMISFADLAQEASLYQPAIANIEAELPNILGHHAAYNRSGYDRSILAARCYQALTDWHTAQGNGPAASESLSETTRHCAVAGLERVFTAGGLAMGEQQFLAAIS